MRTYLFPLLAVIFTMFASPVLAEWDSPPKDGSWLPPVIAVLLALLVVGANMKNSKRGHQD